MALRVLITGCTGTLGPWVARALRESLPGSSLWGVASRPAVAAATLGLDEMLAADLRDPGAARALVARARPDRVVHLASRREGDLDELLQAQVAATHHVLEAVRQEMGQAARVLVVGSAAEIGLCGPAEMPLAEGCACRPVDLYGVSKLAQSALAFAHWFRHGQWVVRARLFNLLGPGLSPALLPGRCVELLRAAARGERGPLRFRALDTQRDYVDVRDAAAAVASALERGRPGALYHVGSGVAIRGRAIVEHFLAVARRETGPLRYEESADGPATVPLQIADAGLAARELGWRPRISVAQSVADEWSASAAPGGGSRPATATESA